MSTIRERLASETIHGLGTQEKYDGRALLAALDALVEVVERVGGPGDACHISPDAGGPVCKVHYSAPVGGGICYWVAGFRAAIAHAKDVTG